MEHWTLNMVTDHKPLELILKKSLANTEALKKSLANTLERMHGMIMCLQKHDINLIYVRGMYLLPANTQSRAYIIIMTVSEAVQHLVVATLADHSKGLT